MKPRFERRWQRREFRKSVTAIKRCRDHYNTSWRRFPPSWLVKDFERRLKVRSANWGEIPTVDFQLINLELPIDPTEYPFAEIVVL